MQDIATIFSRPIELVKHIWENIERMGGPYAEKAWMYMRWMTRPYPDLGIFKNFSLKDLYIPMTSCIRDVACCLGLCQQDSDFWNDPEKISIAREKITQFARELFPRDPAKVDYPLYVLGRWIKGKDLGLQLLEDYLDYWGRVWDEIKVTPITFDIVSREVSAFEETIRDILEKLNFLFYYEPYTFSLGKGKDAPKYTPDFVLPRCRKKGRTVILEPHGIWTGLQKRIVKIGKSRFAIWVPSERKDTRELLFVTKLEKFKNASWRNRYYLVLIVPSQFKDRVEVEYPEIADEVWDAAEVPKLLYDLKSSS